MSVEFFDADPLSFVLVGPDVTANYAKVVRLPIVQDVRHTTSLMIATTSDSMCLASGNFIPTRRSHSLSVP